MRPIITLNSKKFAADKKDIVNSLFSCGGTYVGYYKHYKHIIKLFNLSDKYIGVITENNVLLHVSKLENGKNWYSHMSIKEIGEYSRYTDQRDEVTKALNQCNIKIKY